MKSVKVILQSLLSLNSQQPLGCSSGGYYSLNLGTAEELGTRNGRTVVNRIGQIQDGSLDAVQKCKRNDL